MSSWDRMGNRPIRFEEDVYWDRNGFGRYGESYYEEVYDQNQFGYFGCGEEQNGWSRNEEDDESLKDLMKTFIKVQNVKDEELELSLKMMDIQVDQSLRNYQARLRELEQKFERMNERLENQPTGQFQNHIQYDPNLSNNQHDQGLKHQQNQWPRHEEEERSLKEVFIEFIRAQNLIDEELELSMKVLNEKLDQIQANLQDMEMKLKMMNECLENQQTGQISSYTQSNPRLSNNDYDQGLRYQTPSHNAKNANAKDTRSGLNHGNGEEHNGKENKKIAERGPVASQSNKGLRGNSTSEGFPVVVDQSIASQSILLRRNSPEQPENDPEARLEVGNHMGDELMVYDDDETPKYTPNHPTSAYESRKEDSLETELQELLGTEMGKVDDAINVDITLDEFERLFGTSEGSELVKEMVVVGEKELESETGDENETGQANKVEPCEKLKVDTNPISELKGTFFKLVELVFILTCLEKKEVSQVTNYENDEPLNFDDLLHGKPSMKGVEKDKYGGEVGMFKQDGGVSIMRETKEWHDAIAKTRMKLDVATYRVPCDDVVYRSVGECGVFERWYEHKYGGDLCFHACVFVG